MAYTQFDLILANHYNTFVAGAGTFGIFDHATANINTVWGVGVNDKGYGQSTILTQVPVGAVVSATQWSTLIARILSSANHQVTSLGTTPGDGVLVASNALIIGLEYEIVTPGTGDWTTAGAGDSLTGTHFIATATTNGQADGTARRPLMTSGDLIAAIATLQTSVNDIFANRLNAIATASTSIETASGTTAWPASSVHTVNVQFSSADAVRYFFNSGGTIAITMSRSGGASNAKNDSWDDEAGAGVLPYSGTVILGEHGTTKSGGSGTENTDWFIEGAIGYYELDIAPIQIFQQFVIGGGVYGTNNVAITAVTNGTQGSNGDTGDLLTFVITMTDDAGDPPSVDGTTEATVTVNYPATTYLTEASWSTVTFIPASTVVQT